MSLARHMAVMRNAPFLKVLNEDALKLLAFGSEPVTLKPRQALFEAGEQADSAILVLGGQLRLTPASESLSPRVAGVGQLIDELALIVPITRGSSAAAQTTCELLVLPRSQMLRILEEYPDAARRLQAMIASRAATFMGEIGNLSDKLQR
ncbi:Crp/Fnr family transcriptional regulator [Acuticoccus mangrovi]|uniref:Cyclic nucleotide-binding domain-containing protein n=1 Tax=Acuticoccus mangrovi TaxID=2796142 RepID=A0A934MGA4_9HYPH|nr:cyclic nucleotide-binding domain-containing protein [Acuticoccus mangrovi]